MSSEYFSIHPAPIEALQKELKLCELVQKPVPEMDGLLRFAEVNDHPLGKETLWTLPIDAKHMVY